MRQLLRPKISGFGAELNGFAAEIRRIAAPGNSQENPKTVEIDENPLMRHM